MRSASVIQSHQLYRPEGRIGLVLITALATQGSELIARISSRITTVIRVKYTI